MRRQKALQQHSPSFQFQPVDLCEVPPSPSGEHMIPADQISKSFLPPSNGEGHRDWFRNGSHDTAIANETQWELFWDWWVRDRCPPPTDDAKSGRRWSWRHSSQFDTRKGEAEAMVEAGGLLLKLQYFGHLMRQADSFEKTMMLGMIEGRRRR